MPGLGKRTSEVILAEIGQDMSRFPTAGHLCSWAGICPGNNESAGKRRYGKTRNGNKTLKSILVECAQVSRPEELPLKSLSEPYVIVSHHTAPNYTAVKIPYFQCANSFLSFDITKRNHLFAFSLECIFLYFLLVHFIRHLLTYFKVS